LTGIDQAAEPSVDGQELKGDDLRSLPAEAVRQLRTLLADANRLAGDLQKRLEEAGGDADAAPDEVAELESRLAAAEEDRSELTARLVDAERQAGKLMNLYVATYQLHATLDPSEVQATIAEIAVDLLGADRFALLLKDDQGGGCEVALARGAEEDPSGRFVSDRYLGGDAMVDATLEDGLLRLGPQDGSTTLAAVPLRVEDAIVGALVILKLLDHRVSPLSEDRDILDLLAAHAASALFAARVYSNTDRKLRTLESLVRLIRG
jgi:hypothetical protein